MSEYEVLKAYLATLPYYQWEAAFSFEQLEKLLGRKLPPSAYKHRPWWGNDYGVSLREEWVRFVRVEKRRWPR